ncbi:MAG: hypothetical protein JNM22_15825 [Saprospiraceae bacterium]|nr:hypothetical protein [Saprospiraceae bacterium]
MSSKDFFASIRELLARNNVAEALVQMRIFLEKTPHLNDILQQSGRLENIRQQSNLGLVSLEEATLEQNRIRYGVLELLADIERQGAPPKALQDLLSGVEQESARPEVQQEVQQAISITHSKNVVVNSSISAQNVHIGDINYGPAAVAPIQPLNELLTRTLIPAIQAHSIAATRFLEKVAALPEWYRHTQAVDKAREILAYSFVGVIGIQLSKLFAIGKEEFSENTRHKYIEKCLQLARRSLDLLVFAFMSQLWEEQRKQPRSFDAEQTRALADFFDRAFEPSIRVQAQLLETLHRLFLAHQLPFPIPEMADFGPHFQAGSVFRKAVDALQQMDDHFGKKSDSPEDCLATETALTDLLTCLHFLAAYHMASIKRIGYWQIRTEQPRYLHRFAALGIDSKANVDAEKIDFTDETAYTDAVLLYRGDRYQAGINLSPFVIDHNALLFESGVKACFYRARALTDEQLEFCFLEDNSMVNVAWKGLIRPGADLNELLFDPENQKIYNLDNVIAQFRDARKCILGNDTLSFDDL